jgi:hypothetical protein
MNMLFRLARPNKYRIAVIGLVLTSQVLLAKESDIHPKANTARIMWSAFSCATFAEMSGDKKEQGRLFELGYETGKIFVDGVRTKTISEAEIEEAPVGVLWHVAGPTTEFVIGRIFEAAINDAYEKVVKEDSAGLPITDPSKWANDELKIIRAKNKYLSSNCALIR